MGDYDLNDIVEMKKQHPLQEIQILEDHSYGCGYSHQMFGMWHIRVISAL